MADPSYEDFKAEILSCGNEDLTGVYEAWWTANSWYPDRPASERLHYAERALSELAAEGLIELFRGSWEDAMEHPITALDRAAILKEWGTWAIPEGPHVFFTTTAAGDQA